MAELTGADAVRQYILQADKSCFEIFLQNSNSKTPVFRYKGQQAKDAAEAFSKWATIFTSGGQNYEPYRIVVSTGIDSSADENKDKQYADKRWQSTSTTFVLNAVAGMGAPQRGQNGEIVYVMPGQQAAPSSPGVDLTKYVAKEEMAAAIAHATLNMQMQMRLDQLEAENMRLYKELRDYDYDDDDEEDSAKQILGIWTPDKANEVISGVRKAAVDIISAVQNKPEPRKLNQVAGPQDTAQQKAVTIPAGAVPGTYPPYVDTPWDQPTLDLIVADQNIKIPKIVKYLFQYDAHIGDDLLKLAYIATYKEKTYNNAIAQLREEIVPQSFYDEVMK